MVRSSALLALVSVVSVGFLPSRAPAKIHLTLATLHAANLTAPRAATDSVDEPYYLISIVGPHSQAETIHLPTTGHLRIHRDEALGSRPLVDLSVAPGDTVRMLVSVLDGAKGRGSNEDAAASASTKAMSQSSNGRAAALSSALAPVIKQGAHWLGSATLMVTNDGGTVYWRALECVATCSVLSGASPSPFPAPTEKPLAGVVELSGSGATYHMQLQGQRAQ